MKHMTIAATSTAPLLNVENLTVTFATERGPLPALDGVSLSVSPGETLAVVGESGSGKSVLSLAIMGLLAESARVSADRLDFDGEDLTRLPRAALRDMRGSDMAMIF